MWTTSLLWEHFQRKVEEVGQVEEVDQMMTLIGMMVEVGVLAEPEVQLMWEEQVPLEH